MEFQFHSQTVSAPMLPYADNGNDRDSSNLRTMVMDIPPVWLEPSRPINSLMQPTMNEISVSSQIDLSEMDMVQFLHLKKFSGINLMDLYPVISEVDVHSCNPAELLKAGRRYFMSFSRYTHQSKPKRLRTTNCGYRWKQQGRAFALKYNGYPVAIKTYLSYVALKPSSRNKQMVGGSSTDPNYITKASKNGRIRRHAVYTMEEIILIEDYTYEKNLTGNNIRPYPIPVFCHIMSKYDNKGHYLHTTPTPAKVPRHPFPTVSDKLSSHPDSENLCRIPDLESNQDSFSCHQDDELSVTFNGLESLNETIDTEIQVMMAELSYISHILSL